METEATLHKSGVLITIFCLPHPIFQPDNVAQSHFIWHSLDKPSPDWKSPFPFILAGLNPQSSSAFCSCLQWQFSMGCQKKKKKSHLLLGVLFHKKILWLLFHHHQIPSNAFKRATTPCNVFNCEFVEFERNSSSWWPQNFGITRNVHDPQLLAGKHSVTK